MCEATELAACAPALLGPWPRSGSGCESRRHGSSQPSLNSPGRRRRSGEETRPPSAIRLPAFQLGDVTTTLGIHRQRQLCSADLLLALPGMMPRVGWSIQPVPKGRSLLQLSAAGLPREAELSISYRLDSFKDNLAFLFLL